MTSVSQVGTDRIIDLQFSDGQYRLFLEFYAGGNIVLTDRELNVLALLRIVSGGAEEDELRVGLKYSLEHRQNVDGVPALTKERLTAALQAGVEKEPADAPKKSRRKAGGALRKALATTITEFPPLLVDHALSVGGFDAELRPEQILKDDSLLVKLLSALQEAENVVQQITSSESTTGYIIAKRRDPSSGGATGSTTSADGPRQGLIYEDFHPFKPRQFEADPGMTILSFEGFNKTVDEFFSSIEGQRLESKLQDREESAKKKLDAARRDHEKRVGGLQSVQELNVRKAQAIEANVPRVEEAVGAVNSLIGQGMDWVEIARLIEMEQQRQNAVALMIKLPLKLYENTATLLLNEAEDEEDDFEGYATGSDVSDSDDGSREQQTQRATEKQLAIDIDLALSPWANARQYYDQKKSAAVKEQKTMQSSSKALKSTEKKIAADLKKGLKQEKQVLRPVRQQFWFEKFHYFISSDGYMVLAYVTIPRLLLAPVDWSGARTCSRMRFCTRSISSAEMSTCMLSYRARPWSSSRTTPRHRTHQYHLRRCHRPGTCPWRLPLPGTPRPSWRRGGSNRSRSRSWDPAEISSRQERFTSRERSPFCRRHSCCWHLVSCSTSARRARRGMSSTGYLTIERRRMLSK